MSKKNQHIVIFRMGYGKWHFLRSSSTKNKVHACGRFNRCRVHDGQLSAGVTGRDMHSAEIRLATAADVDRIVGTKKMCQICMNLGLPIPDGTVTAAMAEEMGLQVEATDNFTDILVTRASGTCPICKQATMLPASADPRPVVILRAGSNGIKGCDQCIRMLLEVAKPIPIGATVSLKPGS